MKVYMNRKFGDFTDKEIKQKSIKKTSLNYYYWIYEKLKFSKNEKILDFGCGSGLLCHELNNKAQVFGFDVSFSEVKAATRLLGNRFIIARAEHLPFKEHTFDKVFAVEVMEHIPDALSIAPEITRITRNGGHIIIHGPNMPNIIYFIRTRNIKDLIKTIKNWKRGMLKRNATDYFKEREDMLVFSEVNTYSIINTFKQKCGVVFSDSYNILKYNDRRFKNILLCIIKLLFVPRLIHPFKHLGWHHTIIFKNET